MRIRRCGCFGPARVNDNMSAIYISYLCAQCDTLNPCLFKVPENVACEGPIRCPIHKNMVIAAKEYGIRGKL